MSWLNPFAFVGLLALAVPILVHLFGRRIARRQKFPSLRLLRHAQPTPATRSRPSDLLLLAMRCLTITAAVTALAQPRWSGMGARAPVRAILIDTSASMQRLTSDGSTAVQQARLIATRLADSSSDALVMESSRPGASLAGAASWLARWGGSRELVVISDFQAGSLEEGNLASVPMQIGTRLIRVDAGNSPSGDTVTGLHLTPEGTSARWTMSHGDSLASMTVLAADNDREALGTTISAVHAVTSEASTSHRVTVVFPGAPTRAELLAQGAPLDSAWQGDFLLALARDPAFASVAPSADVVPSCETRGAVVARNRGDQPVASIARGEHGVAVFACVAPGTVVATALLTAVETGMKIGTPMPELEPNYLPDETLQRWERPAIESTPHGPGETSPDGRWFWALALVFLVAEEWLRRRNPRRESSRVNEVRDERVA